MLFGDSIAERQGRNEGDQGEATAMVHTRNKGDLDQGGFQGLESDYFADGGNEVKLLGQCPTYGSYTTNTNFKNEI